jgi:penicillin-binding protein 2
LAWKNYLESFGIGRTLGVDVSNEKAGWLKPKEYYDKMHGVDNWNYARIISLSFGQGELGLTPLQMANAVTVIANRGHFFTPHLIKQIDGLESIPEEYLERRRSKISPINFDPVIRGMWEVTKSGTSTASAIPGINIGGKTGTVQNPHGKNHSAFVAFAPIEDPQIAIAVVVEESGYGATWAAPIANLMIENYLRRDSVPAKPYLIERIENANLIPKSFLLDNGE